MSSEDKDIARAARVEEQMAGADQRVPPTLLEMTDTAPTKEPHDPPSSPEKVLIIKEVAERDQTTNPPLGTSCAKPSNAETPKHPMLVTPTSSPKQEPLKMTAETPSYTPQSKGRPVAVTPPTVSMPNSEAGDKSQPAKKAALPPAHPLEEILLDTWAKKDEPDHSIAPLMSQLSKQNCDYQTQQAKWTSLMILSGLPDVPGMSIRQIIQLGANPGLADSRGWTALHWAAFHGSPQATQEMLALAQDLLQVTKASGTHQEKQKENAQEVLLLLLGLLKMLNQEGLTPLQLAQQQRNEKVVQVLQQAAETFQNALVNVKADKESDSPAKLAGKKSKTFEEVLLETWDNHDTTTIMTRLNSKNVNNKTTDDKWTPLMILAGLNAADDAIQKALAMGANPYIKDKEGWNALHWAAFHGSSQAAHDLVHYKKLLEATDKKGRTPLVTAKQEKNTEVARLIEEAMGITPSSSGNSSKDADTITKTGEPIPTPHVLRSTQEAEEESQAFLSKEANRAPTIVPPSPDKNKRYVSSNSGEIKEEIEDPQSKTDKKGSYDLGDIENVPTHDTVPLMASTSTDAEEEGSKETLITKKDPTKVEKDNDSTSSDSTEELNKKRQAERKCGIYICIIGMMGVIVGMILLLMGMMGKSDEEATSAPTPTRPEAPPTVPTPTLPNIPILTIPPSSAPVTSTPTPLPTTRIPTEQPTQEFTILLTPFEYPFPDVTRQAILQDPESAQAQAYQWLLKDPNLDSYSVARAFQRFALAVLYYSTGGGDWDMGISSRSRFLSYSVHECQWMPLLTRDEICNGRDEYLVIYLPNMNLRGTLPPEVPLLIPTLEALELPANAMTGSIPTYIGGAPRLESLDLSMNHLTGRLPNELGECTQMSNLVLHLNAMLESSLPTELGRLELLEEMWVFGTALTGTIPSELGNLDQLQVLYLQQNLLQGTIPPELFQDPNSEAEHAASAECPLPSDDGACADILNPVQCNKCEYNSGCLAILAGFLPSDCVRAAEEEAVERQVTLRVTRPSKVLEELRLDSNRLTGPIPSQVGLLGESLVDLIIAYNALSSAIPTEISQATLLRRLFLNDNPKLAGQIRDENTATTGDEDILTFDELINLQELTLDNTSITGVLPNSLCDLTVLEFTCSDDLCGCECECSIAATPPPTAFVTSKETMALTVEDTFAVTEATVPITSSPSLPPSFSPTAQTPTTSPIFQTFEPSIYSDPSSPQARAIQWLQDDPSFDEYRFFRAQQRLALAVFYYSTLKTPWLNSTNWLSYKVHECDWFADPGLLEELHLDDPCQVAVDVEVLDVEENRQYVAILLPNNGLHGVLPPELTLLSELRVLELGGNRLMGNIPVPFGLPKLEELDLSHNELSQPIPSTLGSLAALETLKLNHNVIRGAIPTQLGNIGGLKHLNLHNTLLTGRIPGDLIQLSDLETLTFNGTLISGRIPLRLCRVDNLQFTCSSRLCGCSGCACPSLRFFGR